MKENTKDWFQIFGCLSLLFLVIIVLPSVGLFSCARGCRETIDEQDRFERTAPCEAFATRSFNEVPARCHAYFQAAPDAGKQP